MSCQSLGKDGPDRILDLVPHRLAHGHRLLPVDDYRWAFDRLLDEDVFRLGSVDLSSHALRFAFPAHPWTVAPGCDAFRKTVLLHKPQVRSSGRRGLALTRNGVEDESEDQRVDLCDGDCE